MNKLNPKSAVARAGRLAHRGFTLIELMIVVAIIAILAGVAYPAYTDYIIRGKLVEATNALAGLRAQMEQYYQDNRTYAEVTGITWPCKTANLPKPSNGEFTVTCENPTPDSTKYGLKATGTSGAVTNFTYTVNYQDVRTTAFPARWNSTTCATAWLMKKGAPCS